MVNSASTSAHLIRRPWESASYISLDTSLKGVRRTTLSSPSDVM